MFLGVPQKQELLFRDSLGASRRPIVRTGGKAFRAWLVLFGLISIFISRGARWLPRRHGVSISGQSSCAERLDNHQHQSPCLNHLIQRQAPMLVAHRRHHITAPVAAGDDASGCWLLE